jgi:hypothetical protein
MLTIPRKLQIAGATSKEMVWVRSWNASSQNRGRGDNLTTALRTSQQMRQSRTVFRIFAVGFLTLAVAGVWMRRLHRGPPPGLLKDIRAGIGARTATDPDERLLKYLDGRYGPMTDSTNRQQAFVDFFDVDHIKALHFLVQHSPEGQRQANINAMARWLASYRTSLNSAERAALKVKFQGSNGPAMLRRATAQYNSQDVYYRGRTAPVISELLKTMNYLESAP